MDATTIQHFHSFFLLWVGRVIKGGYAGVAQSRSLIDVHIAVLQLRHACHFDTASPGTCSRMVKTVKIRI